MANEGSTKPTYSELEAENLRVRGLLQRLEWSSADGDGYAMCPVCEAEGPVANCPADPHEADCWLAAEISGTPANEASPTFPQSSSLASQAAESADIGKLDTADKKVVEFQPCLTCDSPLRCMRSKSCSDDTI